MNDSPFRRRKRWFVSRIGCPPKAISRPVNRLAWACLLMVLGSQAAGSTRQIDTARIMASPPTEDRPSQAFRSVSAEALYLWPGRVRHGFNFSGQAQTPPLGGACQREGRRQPTEVRIGLRADGERLLLEVVDNGTGFDTSSPKTGMGLGMMRERAEGIGAVLRVASAPRQGTHITVIYDNGAHAARSSNSVLVTTSPPAVQE